MLSLVLLLLVLVLLLLDEEAGATLLLEKVLEVFVPVGVSWPTAPREEDEVVVNEGAGVAIFVSS